MTLDLHDVIVSTWRWFAGVSIGSLIAFAVAVLVGRLPWALSLIRAITGFLRCLPILALVPLVRQTVGIDEHAKILLISWACFFPVFLSTIGSIGLTVPDLELRMGVRGLSRGHIWLRYQLPRLLTGFVSGVEIAVGIAWLTVVAAETLGTLNQGVFRGGLGHAVFVAFENSNYGLGLSCLAVFGFLGLITSLSWRWLAGRLVTLLSFDRSMLAAR